MVETVNIDILSLLLVLTVAWIFGGIAERFGYPTMMGELFAGIVFGPTLIHAAVSIGIPIEDSQRTIGEHLTRVAANRQTTG